LTGYYGKKVEGRMKLKYFGSIDCRGKYAKTANFVMKYIYERIGTTHEGDAGNRI
jgi:hypothetical protein